MVKKAGPLIELTVTHVQRLVGVLIQIFLAFFLHLATKGIATRSKDATSSSWPYY